MNRVVVTGMGVVSPLGNDVESAWSNLIKGNSGIRLIERFDASRLKTRIAGTVTDFDAEALFGKKDARKLDRFCQYALFAAEEAVRQARLPLERLNKERLAVYVGSGIGGLQTLIDNETVFKTRGPDRVSPQLVPMMITNMAAAQISMKYGAHGPTLAPVTACSIGNTAIGEACRLLRLGVADVVMAGGAEAAITELSLASFGNATALSVRNEAPERASRPFDADRDGFVMGEGAGMLILETLAHAEARGAGILAEIVGYGASSDAYHPVATHPEGYGAYLAMKAALSDAGLTPQQIGVISAHATSTEAGDLSETIAIKRLFGEAAYRVPITANKSMTGHMLGAAGAFEAIALVETLRCGIIPPTINLEHPDPNCDLDYVPLVPRRTDALYGLSNSFGFGGHNAAIVIKRWEAGGDNEAR
ncbi:beta-ketoacyl-ACP synthase II [Paenibacillus chartarius]|uniref:3-oxoacyl-[acyl-carrier-protein] synthase 2 n=1 Tax=Paenibacillus chartarius TaxID=747481 RepID=A0ABV6DI77_9BACL